MSSKKTLCTLFFIPAMLVMGAIFASARPGLGERVDSGVRGMVFDHNAPVTMTDGLPLRVNIYRPDKPGRFPVLMLMGPYGKDTPYADAPAYKPSWSKLLAKYPDLCKKSSCRYLRFESPDPEHWVQDGYIVIAADTRGPVLSTLPICCCRTCRPPTEASHSSSSAANQLLDEWFTAGVKARARPRTFEDYETLPSAHSPSAR